jgi:hypothetical protein
VGGGALLGELVRSLVAPPGVGGDGPGGGEVRCRPGKGHALKKSPVTLARGARADT